MVTDAVLSKTLNGEVGLVRRTVKLYTDNVSLSRGSVRESSPENWFTVKGCVVEVSA